jgi:hypothetical protein
MQTSDHALGSARAAPFLSIAFPIVRRKKPGEITLSVNSRETNFIRTLRNWG